jgi:hypothetical protein
MELLFIPLSVRKKKDLKFHKLHMYPNSEQDYHGIQLEMFIATIYIYFLQLRKHGSTHPLPLGLHGIVIN